MKVALQDSAARRVHGATELLEQILLSVDEKTLLQMVIHDPRAREVFEGSTKIKKKLWIIQPTFEEKVRMGDIDDNIQIFACAPGKATFRNTLVTDTTELKQPNLGLSICLRIPSTIVHDKMHSVHGLWERMHINTKTDFGPHTGIANFDVKAKVAKVLNPDASKSALTKDHFVTCLPSWQKFNSNSKPLKKLMREVEVRYLEKHGIAFNWATADLFTDERPIPFGSYKKLCHLAAKDGATYWHQLSVWKSGQYPPPSEQATDVALKLAGLSTIV